MGDFYAKSICASAGPTWTSHSLSPSLALLAIGHTYHEAVSALRLLFSLDTIRADVDEVLRTVPELVKELRKAPDMVIFE